MKTRKEKCQFSHLKDGQCYSFTEVFGMDEKQVMTELQTELDKLGLEYSQPLFVEQLEALRGEIWKEIPNYPNYLVSNLGRVKSLGRTVNVRNGGTREIPDSILLQSLTNAGYLVVTLSNIKQKVLAVHQLVAMAFLDHTPDGYDIVVDHINGIRTNNKLKNLQLLTTSQNLKKSWKTRRKMMNEIAA